MQGSDAINYTEQVLLSDHINLMVNMGAIKMCALIAGKNPQQRFKRLLELTRCLTDNPGIQVGQKGNSVAGMELMHRLSNRFYLSIF